jgi:hypothetical protein
MPSSDLAVALDLQAAATRAIRASLLEGERKYGPGSLAGGNGTLSPRECLSRIAAHVDAALAGDRSECHVAHILVRCAMLLHAEATVETTVEETQGPEGYTDTPAVSRSPLPVPPQRLSPEVEALARDAAALGVPVTVGPSGIAVEGLFTPRATQTLTPEVEDGARAMALSLGPKGMALEEWESDAESESGE